MRALVLFGLVLFGVSLVFQRGSAVALPRGYRNNNPGNIRWDGRTQWAGMAGADAAGFVIFSAAEYGYRAAARVLRSYERQGYNTVEKIINRWAPPSENDTGAYVQHVAAQLGVQQRQVIRVDDHMVPLLRTIARHENGYVLHSDALIQRGATMA